MPSGAAASPASDPPPLLDPDEPPAFTVVNPDGAGPMLLVCDHASRRVPRRLGALGLPEAELCRHIAWDIGAEPVARLLSARFDAPLLMTGYSRLVIDINRSLDDPTSIPVISDGAIVPGNRGLGAADKAARAAALFHPYQRAVGNAVDAMLARGVRPAIVSMHSFTPVYKHQARPWHVGILWNDDDRMARPLIAALSAMGDILVGDNEPYSGRDGVGYTVGVHGGARGLPHVTFEVRQDLIESEAGQRDWAERLGAALAPLMADPALHARP